MAVKQGVPYTKPFIFPDFLSARGGSGMSDIASKAQLAQAAFQLPVSWYFDQKVFELEKKLLFDAGPGYVGH